MGAPWLTSAVAAVGGALENLGLLVDVQHEAWIGDLDAYKKPDLDDPVTLRGMVQEGTMQIRTARGETIAVRACISFFEPITPNGATGRREPIDPRDRLTLPSGYTGVIVNAPGAQLLAGDTTPFSASRPVHTVWLK
jgi:hypothetical protein